MLPQTPPHRPLLTLRELRLATGLVLALFLTTHFLNHALGLVSVDAMEEGRRWFNVLWRNPVGTALFYGAVLIHFGLALYALYRRRTLKMPPRETAQLVLGLSLPFLVIPHVLGTRLELVLLGTEPGYPEVVRGLWIARPENGLRQTVALLIAWTHGCFGLWFWLRPKPWFARYALFLFAVALLVPVLALLGFAEAGKEIAAAPERFPAPVDPYDPQRNSAPDLRPAIGLGLYATFAGLIAATFAARLLRMAATWRGRVRIHYPGQQMATVPQGFSILEASRAAGIPHVSVCGGRGRCSTCRVRVVEGLERQPPPAALERGTLARIKAGPDVRLACQLRPSSDVAVAPVLWAGEARVAELAQGSRSRGQEREIAVLFCDLRGFTSLAERRLPFDTVFLLNRYFQVVGQAVEEAGGHIDKFVGDGALALFGLQAAPGEGARQAVRAALTIHEGLARLNAEFASELDQPLRLVMSLHAGPAIVGEMGYGPATSLTAVGDTLNAASRLEGLAKELDVELVISDDFARRAGLDLAGCEHQTVTIRGRAAPLGSWIVPEAESLGQRA